MEVTMRVRALTFPVAIAAFVFGLTPSWASVQGSIEANVPFEFVVGEKVFPPADYIFDVASTGGPSVVTIRSKESGERVMFDTDQIEEKADPKALGLVFDKIRDRLYLMEVWGVVDTGRAVKHIVDGELLKRAPEGSRQRIKAVRVAP